MTQCFEKDCTAPATHYLQVTVAPWQHPIARGMKMQLGLQFCHEHAVAMRASDLFDDEMKKKLREITRIVAKSDVPLDFTRTKIEVREIGDDMWQLLNNQTGQS